MPSAGWGLSSHPLAHPSCIKTDEEISLMPSPLACLLREHLLQSILWAAQSFQACGRPACLSLAFGEAVLPHLGCHCHLSSASPACNAICLPLLMSSLLLACVWYSPVLQSPSCSASSEQSTCWDPVMFQLGVEASIKVLTASSFSS